MLACLVLLLAGPLGVAGLGSAVAVQNLGLGWGVVHRGLLGGAGRGAVAHLLGLLHVIDRIDWSVARLRGVVGAGLGVIFRLLGLTVSWLGLLVSGLLLVDLLYWRRTVVCLLGRVWSPWFVLRRRPGRRAIAWPDRSRRRAVAWTGLGSLVGLLGWRWWRWSFVHWLLNWGLEGGVLYLWILTGFNL